MAEQAQANQYQLLTAQVAHAGQGQKFLQKDTRRGHWLGWSIAALAIIGAVTCAWLEHPYVAALLVSVPVLGVARQLIDGVRSKTDTEPEIEEQPEESTEGQKPT